MEAPPTLYIITVHVCADPRIQYEQQLTVLISAMWIYIIYPTIPFSDLFKQHKIFTIFRQMHVRPLSLYSNWYQISLQRKTYNSFLNNITNRFTNLKIFYVKHYASYCTDLHNNCTRQDCNREHLHLPLILVCKKNKDHKWNKVSEWYVVHW